MYERTDGSSYKRPITESVDQSISDRNKEIQGLINDDPNALEPAAPPAPTPTPTPAPQKLDDGGLAQQANASIEAARQQNNAIAAQVGSKGVTDKLEEPV